MTGNVFTLKFFLSLFLSKQLPMNIRKKLVFQQAVSIESGKNRGSQKLPKRGIETTAVSQNNTTKI